MQPPISLKKVLVGGCFDVLHFGHIKFLTQAAHYGDQLIVALESDANVSQKKGPTRPIHTQEQRKTMLLSLKAVHTVIELGYMKSDIDYEELVLRIRPQIIAVTENDPYITQKQKQAEKIGAQIVIISKVHTPSTTQLAKLLEIE